MNPDPTIFDGFPPGYKEEYIGYILQNTAIAFIVLETVFVALRYLAQRIGRKPFGIDDWLMMPAWLFCFGANIAPLVGMGPSRIGYHLAAVIETDLEALDTFSKVIYAMPILYSLACCFPKLVILTLYLRIFTLKVYRVICHILIAIVISMTIANVFVGILICTPPAFLWDDTVENGHCINIPIFYRWGTLPNAITDLFILVLPLPVVWQLHNTMQVKIGLTLTFLTGSIGTITAALRCAAFFQNDPLTDGTWISVTFFTWSIVEPGVYLIAACLPCYRPLLNYCGSRGKTSLQGSKPPEARPSAPSHPSKPRSLNSNLEIRQLDHIGGSQETHRTDDREQLIGNKILITKTAFDASSLSTKE